MRLVEVELTAQKSSRRIAIFALVSVLMVASVMNLLLVQWTKIGIGLVTGDGLGVYWNQNCTNITSSLPFGRLDPRSSKSFILHLRNEGNTAIALNMTSENWNPTNAENYLTLTWNREGVKSIRTKS